MKECRSLEFLDCHTMDLLPPSKEEFHLLKIAALTFFLAFIQEDQLCFGSFRLFKVNAPTILVFWRFSLKMHTTDWLCCSYEAGSYSSSWKEMEDYSPLKSDKILKHRPLTPIRVFGGVICLLVYISTAFMFIVYFGPIIAFGLRLFSVHYCRKATAFLFGLWLALWPFLFEKINRTKMVFSGDSVPAKERVLLIANHRTEVDWMYLWDLALRKGCLGYIKYILKSTLMKLPVFGWGFQILEFISVERKWENDEPVLRQMLSTFKNPQDPLWLAIFPEGTDFTEEKCMKSQKFATEVGLPVLDNVLLPKTRGFCVCLETLRSSLDAVYDVTIAYKNQCPSFLDNVFGVDPSEVHIHIRRIPVKGIPVSDPEAAAWLIDAFQLKDQLLSNFKTEGGFPNQGTEEELSTLKCLVNFIVGE